MLGSRCNSGQLDVSSWLINTHRQEHRPCMASEDLILPGAKPKTDTKCERSRDATARLD